MTRVLIITNDLLSERMASPAIRCWEMAAALGREFKTTLASSNKTEMRHDDFEIKSFRGDSKSLLNIAKDHDVIIIHPYVLTLHPNLKDLGKTLILDLYAPFILEKLEAPPNDGLEEKLFNHGSELSGLIDQLQACDYFICASEIQKRLWTGMLIPLFAPENSLDDFQNEIFNRVIVIPFGIPEKKPTQRESPLKSKITDYREGDFILIWGGGIWNWFDTDVVIEGMKALKTAAPHIKLFFMSAEHPHPAMPEAQHYLLRQTISKAKEADLLNKTIFFNDKWIPYEERCDYFLDSDAGISTHRNHLETRYAFRTRILDYIWCNLPVVCSEGDYLSQLVHEKEIGITIPEHDTQSFVKAAFELSGNKRLYEEYKKNLASLAPDLRWSKLVEPLLDVLKNPSRKKFSPLSKESLSQYRFLKPRSNKPESRKNKIKRSLYYLKYEGLSSLRKKLPR